MAAPMELSQLFPYQVEGARFLATKGRALLADDMGLGKSAQAIAAADAVKAVTALVICPASVIENWRREIARFAKRECAWLVVSYDKAVRSPPEGQWDVLILDEAHYLKTRTAKRTKAIFGEKCDGAGGLVERARHVFLLTGTPTPNNPSEMWPMLRAVMPGAIAGASKPLSYWQFINRYCLLRDNGFGAEIVKGRNLSELRTRIAPYVLRRKKDDVLKDLPPIRFDQLFLEGDLKLPAEMLRLLPELEAALDSEGVAGLAKVAPHVATLRRLTGLAKVAPAREWIKDWLEAGGKKLVVFAHHREVIDQLVKASPHVWARITGDTVDRQEQVDAFQREPDCRVFYGQIQAAGTGITLTAASDVLFVESSWVPAENEQAAMRVHRIGQRNACLVRFATLAGSIDEKIQRAVLRKTADILKLFN